MGKIRCPKCNDLAFSRISYDRWWCEFCHFTKDNKNKTNEIKGVIDA